MSAGFFIAACSPCVPLLHALDPAQAITQYSHTAWSRDHGPFPASARALAQTPDGTLWIGTDSGLLQFDGVRVQPGKWNRQLNSLYINALASAGDGSLWVGTRQGLSHWKEDGVRNYRTYKGASGPAVAAVHVDSDGTVWAATAGFRSGGLCRPEGQDLRCYGPADGLPSPEIYSLFRDSRHNLWVGGLGLGQWKPGSPWVSKANASKEGVLSIAEDRDGQIWAAGQGLRRVVNDRLVPYPIAGIVALQPRVLLLDRDGGLWVGTHGQGLFRLYQGRTDRFVQADGLSNDVVYCLLEDREGNIWVGTDGGLDRFRDFAVTTISKREGLSENTVGSVFATKDGGVWVGTGGGLARVQENRIITTSSGKGLPSRVILGTFEEQSGRLWVATDADLAYRENDAWRTLRLGGKQKLSFAAAAEDRNHSVWFSDPENGLIRVQDARVAEVIPWSQFDNKRAWALEPDHDDGGLWLGLARGGLAYYKSGQPVRWFNTGLRPDRPVMDLHRGSDGVLWIATTGGLSRLHRGQVSTLTVDNGLPCDRVRALVEDDEGALWLNTACGLVRISRLDLAHWLTIPGTRVRVKVFESGDGLRGGRVITGYFRRAVRSTDGRLWFAAFDGLAVVNPRRLPWNPVPPPVKIEQISAGQHSYPIGPELRLPPLTKELRIDYTAMSFVAPDKVQFRYRLDGFDQEWNEAGTRRQAVYTNLPPGRYQFHVSACNNDGVWNQAGASFGFALEPAFYQTDWFRLLCVSACGLLLWSVHRFRVRRMAMAWNVRMQERLAERTRIAREMHDSLLQNISGLALQLESLAKSVTHPSLRDHLREIRRDIEQCLREAREFVWDLRAPTLQEDDLPRALREAGEQITNGEPVQFHMSVSGSQRPAPPVLQQQLLRIVQEAARNSVRHSHAREIDMQLAYLEPDRIQVLMRDDGCGFDTEEASRELGHWGLIIMRERARQIGAELKISSVPGHGTEVDIRVPIAYSHE